uniref:Uncharacterized protein n=1 Tax=Oryza sativa subsp. japonica TaxID=39947 RepID=Q6K444_ORYSJ|nr:hypothetical protein [Oryza sativa Japonica Group]BAD34145.1 hypothetical protein [Oryza sativa Japonica Group]
MVANLAGDVGVERERMGDSNSNPAPCERARGPGDAGERAATWGGRESGVAWAREEGRRRRRGGFGGSGWSSGSNGRRWETTDRWGPPVGVLREEGGAAWAGPQGGGAAGEGWANGPTKKKEAKEKKKRKRIFLGLKILRLLIFNWLKLFPRL